MPKYKRRWRGKDGRWNYEYAPKPGAKHSAREILSEPAPVTEPQSGQLDLLAWAAAQPTPEPEPTPEAEAMPEPTPEPEPPKNREEGVAQLTDMLQHPKMRKITSEAQLRSRLAGMGHTKVCSRCGGSGSHSFNLRDGTTCFGCGGSGKQAVAIDRELFDKVKAQVESGEFEAYVQERMEIGQAKRTAAKAKDLLWDVNSSSDWYAYHYPKDEAGKYIKLPGYLPRHSVLSYKIHDFARRAEDKAKTLSIDMQNRRKTPDEREAAALELARRLPELEKRIRLVDKVFNQIKDSGELVADNAAGHEAKRAWREDDDYKAEDRHRVAALARARVLMAAALAEEGLDHLE